MSTSPLPLHIVQVSFLRKLNRRDNEKLEMKKQLLVFTGVHQMATLYTGNVVRQSRYITRHGRV